MQTKSVETKLNRELIDLLISSGEQLTDSVSALIVDRGRDVIPDLITIMMDDELAMNDAPGTGCVPIHAVLLLQRLNAVEAAEPMFQVLSRCDVMEVLYSTLISALESFGPAIMEIGLNAFAISENSEQRLAIATVLASIHIRDPRIFSVLLQVLQEEVEHGACDLAEYGDPAALPYLSSALDACKINQENGMFGNQDIVELAAAIEDLGGTLTKNQARLRLDASKVGNEQRQALLALYNQSLEVKPTVKKIFPVGLAGTITLCP